MPHAPCASSGLVMSPGVSPPGFQVFTQPMLRHGGGFSLYPIFRYNFAFFFGIKALDKYAELRYK